MDTTNTTTSYPSLTLEVKDRIRTYIRTNPKDALKVFGLAMLTNTIISFLVGLIVFGWWLWPVQWTDIGIAQLDYQHKVVIVEVAAKLNAHQKTAFPDQLTLINTKMRDLLYDWDGHVIACHLAKQEAQATEPDYATIERYIDLSIGVTGEGCVLE